MHRDGAYIFDIVEAARIAMRYLEDMTEEEFSHDVRSQDSVIRRLEIIGEAARRVSEQTQESNPEVPWRSMIGMRNLMIHDYDDVDLSIVWQTVKQDLPRLVVLLEPLAPPEE
jgi:uncharacterized protein with HEPN domain